MPRLIGLAVGPGSGLAIAPEGSPPEWLDERAGARRVAGIEASERPRWVWWSGDEARWMVAQGVRPARVWDLSAVHRILAGGWRADAALVWATAGGLDPHGIPPEPPPVDLFHPGAERTDDPLRADGHLERWWTDGGWASTRAGLETWSTLALDCHRHQAERLVELDRAANGTAIRTAQVESAIEVLCAELEADGLPIDVVEAERIIETFAGPRVADGGDRRDAAPARDQVVLRHVPPGERYDLRNPADVRSLLRRVGVETADTRAHTLEHHRDAHPLVGDLLAWRKAERIATTYGFGWLDANVGVDGRLRGRWAACDGAAGRMTATVGLHNLPAPLRPAVVAEPGFVFVRADLGQIEPRILAAVSGDAALAAATLDDDLYAPVASRLAVPRDVAKRAMIGAMYGQTSGLGAHALRSLASSYPVATAYLERSARLAEGGHDLRTHGGRLVAMTVDDSGVGEAVRRSRAAARGRYGRNAMVQGAAAEFFKTWAAVARAHLAAIGPEARIVLCLHDELLLHVPDAVGPTVAAALRGWLDEAAHRWRTPGSGGPHVRFTADVAVARRWSDAK